MASLPLTWSALQYFSALAGSKTFSNVTDAKQGLNVINDLKVLGKTVVGATEELYEIITAVPEETGGAKTGVVSQSFSQDEETGDVTRSNLGALTLVSADTVSYALLNALGLKVAVNVDIKERITRALNTVFGTSIVVSALNTYYIPVTVKNGLTYVSDKIVKALSDEFYNVGITKGDITVTYNTIQFPSDKRTTKSNFTYTMASTTITSAFSTYYQTHSEPLHFTPTEVINAFHELVKNDSSYIDGQDLVTINIQNLNGRELLSVHYNIYNLPITERPTSYYTDIYNVSSKGTIMTVSYSNKLCIKGDYNPADGTKTLQARYQSGTIWLNTVADKDGFMGSNIGLTGREVYITGIDEQIGANTPKDNDIDIQTKYPVWFGTGIDVGYLDRETDAITKGKLLPIDLQLEDVGSNVYDKAQADATTGAIDGTRAESEVTTGANSVVDTLEDILTGEKVKAEDIPSTPTPTDTPTTPVITNTSAVALATIYNPTEAQINSLKGVLWNESVIDILKTFFTNSPLDAIISLHKIYCTPVTSGTGTIQLGYYNTGISGVNIVSKQYVTIDCGTVNVSEIYGNATDYAPYTNVSIYLPFIGIRDLSANDVVGGRVKVIYKIDVTTGSCIAEITVIKNGAMQLLYVFEGNCAVQVPLSSSNLMRGIVSAATFVGSAIIGSPIGMVGGLASSVGSVSIQRSGSFGSNAGAMGIKKPYIIMNQHLPYDAESYNNIYGYPSNKRVTLSSLTGFTKVKDVHVEGIACTENEKILIENALKDGVFL